MIWLLIGVLSWVALAIPVALLIGRGIRSADTKRALAWPEAPEANFVATETAPADALPVEVAEEVWTGPATVPFAPSRLPWGGDRTSMPRPRPSVVRHPVTPIERLPGARDTGAV